MTSPRTPRRTVRRLGTVGALALTATLLSACLTTEQDTVLRELNNDRRAYGRSSLSIHDQAQRKAQAWAEKLARERALYHSTLSSGFSGGWCSLGENVGYGPSIASIEDAYMASSGHRANILDSKWNGVGVGYAKNGNTVWTVQVFIKAC